MGRINSLRTSFSPQFETRVAPAVPEPEMFPYYLRQPKAKNAHYLKIGEVIIVEEEGLWERAKITDIDLKRYENLSMLITFESERSKDSTTRYLFPGELWGVLRGEDVHLDFTKMRPSVAAGQTQRVRLVSECPQCTASHLLIHPEERSQLQSFLPFTCSHRATAASIVQIAPAPTDLGGVSWEVPRPRHPRLADRTLEPEESTPSLPSSISEVTADRLEDYINQLQDLVDQATRVNTIAGDLIQQLFPPGDQTPDRTHFEDTEIWQEKVTLDCLTLVALADKEVAELRRIETDFRRNPARSERVQGSHASSSLLGGKTQPAEPPRADQNPEERAGQRGYQLVPSSPPSSPLISLASTPSQVGGIRHLTSQGSMVWPKPPRSVRTGTWRTPLGPNRQALTPLRLTPHRLSHHNPPAPSPAQPRQTMPLMTPIRFLSHTVIIAQGKLQRDWDGLVEELNLMQKQKCAREQTNAFLGGVRDLNSDHKELRTLYNSELVALSAKERERLQMDFETTWESLDTFIRSARTKVEKCIVSQVTTGDGPIRYRQGNLEKITLPSFSGRIDEWSQFKKVFISLTEAEGYREIFCVTQLKTRLPHEALDLIRGMDQMEEIWLRLNERYGNREQAILHANHRLSTHVIGGGAGYSQLESLRGAVRTYQTSLRSVDASSLAFSDIGLVGRLILKLPGPYQDRWHYYVTGDFPNEGGFVSQGERFVLWLNREGAAANNQHLAHLSAEFQKELYKGATTMGNGEAAMSGPNASTLLAVAPDVGRTRLSDQLHNEGDCRELKKRMLVKIGPCPACKGRHSYSRRFSWGNLEWPSARLEDCPAFRAKPLKERAKLLEDEGGCALCTSTSHARDRCWIVQYNKPQQQCKEKVGTGECGRPHHPTLHGSASAYCQSNAALRTSGAQDHSSYTSSDKVNAHPGPQVSLQELTSGCLFEHLTIPVQRSSGGWSEALTICDSASNTNFITTALAEQLNLQGQEVEFFLSVIGNQYCQKKSLMYALTIRDRMGELHLVKALGVQAITDAILCPDLGAARRMFPEAPQAVFRRAAGPVQILLSMTEQHLHANGGSQKGGLRLSKTPLGCGWVLTGLLPGARSSPVSLTSEVRVLQSVVHPPPPNAQVFHLTSQDRPPLGFTEAEELGYTPPQCVPSVRDVLHVTSGGQSSPSKIGRS